MARPKKAVVRSAALHATAKYCSTHGDRAQLTGGESFEVDLRLSGKIGGSQIDEAIVGKLLVSPDQNRAGTTAADPAKIVAYLIGDDAAQARKLELLTQGKKLDSAVTVDQVKAAKRILDMFRQTGETKLSKGALRFEAAT